MDIMDLASKGIKKITSAYGKKIIKKGAAPEIRSTEPEIIRGRSYCAGFAKEEIMPVESKHTYYIAGHGSGHKMEGVLSPVYVHAMYIGCVDGGGILWLSADIVGLTNIEVNIIRKRIFDSKKIPGLRAVNFSCTHSHSGIDTVGYWGKANALGIPSDGKVPEYMEALYEKSLKTSIKAYENSVPGKLFRGEAPIPNGLTTNRKIADRHEILYRLRFQPDDGSAQTWIINIGAHPNSLGGGNRLLSGEYPYYMREKISAEAGANVLFGVGAIGGMDAAKLDDDNPANMVRLQGELFARAAMGIENETELLPEIKFVRRQFYMPVCNSVLLLLAMRGTMSFKAFACPESDTGVALKTELTYMCFGSQKILLLPGESFVNTVYGGYNSEKDSATGKGAEVNPAPLCDIAEDKSLIVFGVSNDMTGYVVPLNDFVLNKTQPYLNPTNDRLGDRHYHETNSMGPGAQRVIAQEFKKAVSALNAQ